MAESPELLRLQGLLAEPASPASARQIANWARDILRRIERGDPDIGILPITVMQAVPDALAAAGTRGAPDAWLELATWLQDPPIGAADPGAAERALRKALAAKVVGARVRLAEFIWLHKRDSATADERKLAATLLRERLAEHRDDADALFRLGNLTLEGFGVERDPKAAFALQTRAAQLGNAHAQFELALYHANGFGVPQSPQAAFAATEKAAAAGHQRALYNMGSFYARGFGVAEDMAQAAGWYRKAADAGHAVAAATLACMLASGDGVVEDRAEAEEYFGQAEAAGFDTSEYRAAVGME